MSVQVGALYATLNLDTGRFHSDLRAAGQSVTLFERKISVTSKSVMSLNRVLTGIALSGGFTLLVKSAINAGEEFENFQRRISSTANALNRHTTETTSATQEINFLRETALATGSSFDTLGKAYSRIVPAAASSGIAISDVKDALEGTIGAGVMMGASTEEMKRAFVAIGQVVGKNALQMEELRQQLGEALPNSMLIAARGMTLLKRESGELGEDATVSIGKLIGMIGRSEIDGQKFIQIWKRGTADFKEFAKAASNTVSGQITNMRTILSLGVGDFMLKSGIQTKIIAAFKMINSKLEAIFMGSEESAKELGNKIFDALYQGTLAVGRFFDDVADFNRNVIDVFSSLSSGIVGTVISGLNAIRNIPVIGGVILELGLFGALLFGIKGKLILAGVAGAKKIVSDIIDIVDEASGKLSKFAELQRTSNSADGSYNADMSKMFGNKEEQLEYAKQVQDVSALNDLYQAGFDKFQVNKFVDSDLEGRKQLIDDAIEGVKKQNDQVRKQMAEIEEESTSTFFNSEYGQFEDFLASNESELKNLEQIGAALKEDLETSAASVSEGSETAAKELDAAGGSYEASFKEFLEKLDSISNEVQDANDKLRLQGYNIDVNEGSILEGLSVSKLTNMLKRWDGMLMQFENIQTPAGKIRQQMMKDRKQLEQDLPYLTEIDADKFSRTNLEVAILKRGLQETSHIRTSETTAEVEADLNARLQLFNRLEAKLNSVISESRDARETIEQLDILRAKLQQRGQRFREDALKRDFAAVTFEANKTLSIIRDIDAANRGALGAMVMKETSQKEFNTLAEIEREQVAIGLKDQAASLYTLTDEQLQQKATKSAILTIEQQMAKLDAERLVNSDMFVQDAHDRLAIKQQELAIERQLDELRLQQNGDFQGNNTELEINKLKLDRGNIELKMQAMEAEEFRAETLQLEIDKLQMERENIEMKLAMFEDPEYQMELIALEMEKMELEAANLEQKLRLMETDGYNESANNLEVLQAQVEYMDLMRQYSQDIETRWKIGIADGARSFVSMLSGGIMNVIKGTMSFGDLWKSILSQMIGGVIQFFVQLAVEKAAAFMMDLMFGQMQTASAVAQTAALTATSSAAAATLAVAWAPAATLASIATFGGAAAAGVTAVLAGLATTTAAATTMSTVGSALGAGLGGTVGGAFNMNPTGGSAVIAHTGGIFGTNTIGGGKTGNPFSLNADEGLAILQHGEMIVPQKDVAGAVNAMRMGGVPLPEGVYHSGGIFGAATKQSFATDNIDDDMAEELASPKVEVVNYSNMQDVERHLKRNPAAIINIVGDDHRSNGRTRSLFGRTR